MDRVGFKRNANYRLTTEQCFGIVVPVENMKVHLQTIDEYCGVPEGTFERFIQMQEQELRKIEEERKFRLTNRKKSV